MQSIRKLARLATRRSVASLMLLVALVAVSIFAVQKAIILMQVRSARLGTAAGHWDRYQMLRGRGKSDIIPVLAEYDEEIVRYHRDLARKYRTAAAIPWFAVPDDPPKPRYPSRQAIEDSIDAKLGLPRRDELVKALWERRRERTYFQGTLIRKSKPMPPGARRGGSIAPASPIGKPTPMDRANRTEETIRLGGAAEKV
jgi:hypothetical protein